MRTAAAAGLADDLVAAGVLVPSGVAGLYGKGASFIGTFDGLYDHVTRAGRGAGPELMRFPPLMPRDHFVRTDYLRSFPNLIGSVHGFTGADAEHAELLRAVEQGGDWSAALAATDLVLLPAACYPLYPMLAGRLPRGGRLFDVLGTCFRHEPSDDPARMQVFHQREYVQVGAPEQALEFRDAWLARAHELLSGLGLEVRAVVANDPFFGRAGRMLAASQRDSALKYELVAPIADPEHPTAIASCNCHQDHLTAAFGIETDDGARAHSACVGFGMERITLALFARHGMDVEAWPAPVRAALWP